MLNATAQIQNKQTKFKNLPLRVFLFHIFFVINEILLALKILFLLSLNISLGMRRIFLFITVCITCVTTVNATVRDASSSPRTNAIANTEISRTKKIRATNTSTRNTASYNANTTRNMTQARTAHTASKSRTETKRTTTDTRTRPEQTVSRTASNNVSGRTKTSRQTHNSTTPRNIVARNTANILNGLSESAPKTFGNNYNACRDAYFTCMDQFCAKQNEKYRRCICSSKITQITEREQLLKQTDYQIQDFKDLNINAISKTAAEVKAMVTASEGETIVAMQKDTSAAAKQLAGIHDILSDTKSKSLSTHGTLDIAGDINQIWATTELIGGTNIANLTGEPLYNAVHAQCSEMVYNTCETTATLNMVISAYGMYIENDCSLLMNKLNKNTTAASATVRETEREMQLARLDNYNAHNSTSINDCIAKIRSDITADNACGPDYVHCLDITGKYLNRTTGEPIYTSEFYQLENMTSLSGDILINQTNRLLVAELNNKKTFAQESMKTCQEKSEDIWQEFMRQAIVEIYQAQQYRVRQVKEECLDVVTKCYDTQTQQLKDFSNIKEQLLLGARLELSEEMCREKINACSNLYGGGSDGFALMLTSLHDITDQKIEQQCLATLRDYAHDLCAVPGTDTVHNYPFACRIYSPGNAIYAAKTQCNQTLYPTYSTPSSSSSSNAYPALQKNTYQCPVQARKYTSCAAGFFLSIDGITYSDTPTPGNKCVQCPNSYTCKGGTSAPEKTAQNTYDDIDCGEDYIGTLYHKLARYAIQVCIRPSEASLPLPTTVLQDINVVMDSIRADMSKELATECERLGGIWVPTVWKATNNNNQHDVTGDELYKKFYDETSANTNWGYCKQTEQ